MNTILQKRIEEAAKDIAELCPDCDLHCKGPNPCIPKILYQKLIEISIFALQNQWISVEEALPEDKTKVFVIVKTPVGIVHRADYHINDYWYMSRYSPEEIVTHWMPIPSLEGGEK